MLGVRAAPPSYGEHPRKRRRGMVSDPTSAVATSASAAAVSDRGEENNLSARSDSAPRFILKDGRKIQVGDCALFQAGHAPPFIGIIRWFSACADNHLKLGVNWIYRLADIKLAKGILLEAAPNEVFYSFHRDEIPAASLLHPCKVAFLRKGVELPSGLSSFVCRRVYDVENKCLWWLTDQDYINELQEEVNQLLDKTRSEMHALQSGGRSPKTLNGPASSQLKSVPDTAQNSGTSYPTHIKGKKRERGEHRTELIKRERNSKVNDGDSGKIDMIKAEIAKITEKGGLTSVEAVERLIHLMQLDRADRKIDLAGKVMLADVVAATDKLDCLCRFIQLKGVPILDNWLQEAHKGRTGDGSSPKEGDKSIEELLLALLRALDKLPVNLDALQTCHIGKSVNNLRTHKNLDIQRKARSLVDIWKKRVDEEMDKINDAKLAPTQAVSWSAKTGIPESSHGGNRRAGSSDSMLKTSIVQPSLCKAAVPSKPCNPDAVANSSSVTPGTLKLPSALPPHMSVSAKDTTDKTVGSTSLTGFPSVTAKEEKIGNSGQYQTSNQSFSSDHCKVIGPLLKADAKSSATGSMSTSKIGSGSSRHRRSSNGFGISKEMNIGKTNSLGRTAVVDKASQPTLVSDRTLDLPVSDDSNSHRLIFRFPNPGRSPVRSSSGGSFEEHSMMGAKASSPVNTDKHAQNDRKLKLRSEVCRPADNNTETSVSNDAKEGPVASDDLERSQGSAANEECSKTSDDARVAADSSKATCSSAITRNEVLLPETKIRNSLSSINALVESCADLSEGSAPLSAGDDTGMNLLASVAAGEMSRSNLASPAESPRSLADVEEPCSNNFGGQVRSSSDALAQSEDINDECPDADLVKDAKKLYSVFIKDELKRIDCSAVKNSSVSLEEEKLAGEETRQELVPASTLQSAVSNCKSEGKIVVGEGSRCTKPSVPTVNSEQKVVHGEVKQELAGTESSQLGVKSSGDRNDHSNCDHRTSNQFLDDEKQVDFGKEISEGNDLSDAPNAGSGTMQEVVAEELKRPDCNKDAAKKISTAEGSADIERHAIAAVADGENISKMEKDVPCGDVQNAVFPVNADDANDDKPICAELTSQLVACNVQKKEMIFNASSAVDKKFVSAFSNGVKEVSDTKTGITQIPDVSASPEELDTLSDHEAKKRDNEAKKRDNSSLHISTATEEGKKGVASCTVATESQPAVSDSLSKLDFDLNEGFPGDDGNQDDLGALAADRHSHLKNIHSPLNFAVSHISNVVPVPITVASPAKGPFIPPENLLKSKAEPGWKGSAATSAFRPAEPRKVLEMPLNAPEIPSSDSHPRKQTRPVLDIDLNVPDDRVLEDIASQNSVQTAGSESGAVGNHVLPSRLATGLDLDLNKTDVGTEGQFFVNSSRKVEVPLITHHPLSSGLSNIDVSLSRGFDLNGPGADEIGTEPALWGQHAKMSAVPLVHPFAGIRMNNAELGSLSSWFPPGNSYSAVAIPSFLSDRGEQPYSVIPAASTQRVLGPSPGGSSFGSEMFRNPVLSSSPAMAFSPATAFPYAGYPFGSVFPLASSSFSGCSTTFADSPASGPCFATIPSQFLGQAGAVSSPYARPCVVNVPDSSASGGSETSRKASRQGLDLNTGPGSGDGETDRLVSTIRQLPVVTSQSDDQARIYHMIGGGLKRKEPDGGWDAERSAYKQPSWQ